MAHDISPEELEKKADSYFKKGSNFLVKLFVQTDLTEAADLYIEAAEAYYNNNQYLKSAELFQRAGEIFISEKREESRYEASKAFVKSAEVYYIIDKEKCAEAYGKALEISSRNIEDFSVAASHAVKAAKILKEIRKEKEALEHMYKACELYRNAKMAVSRRNLLEQCAEMEMGTKGYVKALELYKELANDETVIDQVIGNNSYLFAGALCAINISKTNEAYELLNRMDESRYETSVLYKMLEIKTKKNDKKEDLEKSISYLKRTTKLSREVLAAIQDAQISVDPDHDIL